MARENQRQCGEATILRVQPLTSQERESSVFVVLVGISREIEVERCSYVMVMSRAEGDRRGGPVVCYVQVEVEVESKLMMRSEIH